MQKIDGVIDKMLFPSSKIQSMCDDGSLFRAPLQALLVLGAIGAILLGLKAVFDGIADAPLIAIGFLVGMLGAAQVLLYRRKKIGEAGAGRYPVTPIMSEVLRGYGEATAVIIAVLGVAIGLQAIFSDVGYMPGVPHDLIRMKFGALFAGPIAGFIVLSLTHWIVELYQAIVAIANNTAPND